MDQYDHDLINEKAEALGFETNQLKSLEEIKMDYCLNVFMKTDKNFIRAAKLLDISPNTLKALLGNRAKLKKLRDHEVVDINL
jgi:cyanate lyase